MKKFPSIKLLFLVTILPILIFGQVPSYVPTNSLTAWYPFTGNANDLSGNGYNGINGGANLTADRFGNTNTAYLFSNSSITTSNYFVGLNNARSFSFWFYDVNSGTNSYNLFSYGATADLPCPPYGDAFHIIKTGNVLEVNVDCSTILYTIPSYSIGAWYHFAIVVPTSATSISNIQVYCNTILLSSSSLQGNGQFSTILDNPLKIGGSYRNNIGLSGAKLDDIGIWSRALSECEIKKLYYSPSFTISSTSATVCSGQTVVVNSGGVPNYTWSNGSSTSSATLSPLTSTVYSVTSTYTSGCTEAKTITITVNTTPTIAVASGSICVGQAYTLNPTGASTYTYSGGTSVVSPTITSNYTVAGTSAQGCAGSAALVTVSVNANPTITVNSGAICNGQTFTITPSGANTYTYQGGSASVSPSTSTNYTVTGTSTAGCVSQAAATSTVTCCCCL